MMAILKIINLFDPISHMVIQKRAF